QNVCGSISRTSTRPGSPRIKGSSPGAYTRPTPRGVVGNADRIPTTLSFGRFLPSGYMKFQRPRVDHELLFLLEQDVEAGVTAGMPETGDQIGLDFLNFLQIEADIVRNCDRDLAAWSTHRCLLIVANETGFFEYQPSKYYTHCLHVACDWVDRPNCSRRRLPLDHSL